MTRKDLNRRDFAKYTAAAFGGMIAGCGEAKKEPPKTKPAVPAAPPPAAANAEKREPGRKNPKRNGDDKRLAQEEADRKRVEKGEHEFIMLTGKNVCRGLNTCSHHKGGENECAGQGDCAIVKHDCSGMNECKGQGGCGENAGLNECKGKGGCHVPLMDAAWTKARASFENLMKKEGRPFGPAPAKKDSKKDDAPPADQKEPTPDPEAKKEPEEANK